MAAKLNIIDNVYGVEILDEISFKKLTVLPPGTPITKKKDYSFNNKKIQVLNGKYLSSHDKAKCDITLGKIDDKYKVLKSFSPEVVELPNRYTILKDLLRNHYANDEGKIAFPSVGRKNLSLLLTFFTIYPDFGPVYEEYLLDPDFGIKLVNDIKVKCSKTTKLSITQNDIRATAHLLLLLMANNFNLAKLEKEDQIEKFLVNRLTALRHVLKDSNIKFLLNMKNLDQMLFIWNSYPKLKSAVFYFAISIRSQAEINSATMLLAEYSMMTLAYVFKFINIFPISVAHEYPIIRMETAYFLRECKKLKKELGELWIFLEVIRPDDKTFSACNFPNLFMAAAVYVKKFFSTTTSFRRVVKPNLPVMKELIAAAEEKSEDYSISHKWLLMDAWDDAAELMKDIKQWEACYEKF